MCAGRPNDPSGPPGILEQSPQAGAAPPVFALAFLDGAAARRIFERRRERFGTKDANVAAQPGSNRHVEWHGNNSRYIEFTYSN
jgi:hypothetical protein